MAREAGEWGVRDGCQDLGRRKLEGGLVRGTGVESQSHRHPGGELMGHLSSCALPACLSGQACVCTFLRGPPGVRMVGPVGQGLKLGSPVEVGNQMAPGDTYPFSSDSSR